MTSTTTSPNAAANNSNNSSGDSPAGAAATTADESNSASSVGGGNGVGTNDHASNTSSPTRTPPRNNIISSSSNNGNIKLNRIEVEYNQIPDRRAWHIFYQEIREKSEREAADKNFATGEAEKTQNRCLNRYRDVSPYDHSRIILQRRDATGGLAVDYINANLVKLERAERQYILTQGPLSDTVGHFWLMVWEQRSAAILMLNKLMEKKQIKCHKYWPDRKGAANALKLEDVRLSVQFLRCEEYNNYNRRWFKLTDLETKQSREIQQFHYTTWPDFGIPSSPVAFLQFLQQVRESGALDPDIGPAVVHCSAGIGRSGTFCLVDCCLVLIEKEGVDAISVRDVLYELRRYRMGLIQTSDQLYFSYQAIIEGIKLLKDPTFLDNKESSIINCNDDSNSDEQQQYALDETPPPLPPRTHSLLLPPTVVKNLDGTALTVGGTAGKPLPKIPASASCNEELYVLGNNMLYNIRSHQKDALNNFINSEKQQQQQQQHGDDDNAMNNRPLPPLPTLSLESGHIRRSLERVYESDSDEDACNIDDCTMMDARLSSLKRKMSDANTTVTTGTGNAHEANGNNEEQNLNERNREKLQANGTDALNSAEIPNELKHRKYNERQMEIEQKVNEIKRNQRKAEANKVAAKRRRRSLFTYLAAGVIVGVVCVYAYTKFT